MTVSNAYSPGDVTLPLGGVWDIRVLVQDADGQPVDQTPVVTVTLPNGTTATPTVGTVQLGVYAAAYTVAAAGRYIARAVAAGYGAVDLAAYVTTTVVATAMPTIIDVDDYLNGHSFTNVQLQDALDAEAAAQRAVCRVPAAYPADLRQALLRRVARNLKMRPLPLAVLQGDAEGGSDTILPGRDPEVRRLEGPFRKLVLG